MYIKEEDLLNTGNEFLTTNSISSCPMKYCIWNSAKVTASVGHQIQLKIMFSHKILSYFIHSTSVLHHWDLGFDSHLHPAVCAEFSLYFGGFLQVLWFPPTD